MALPLLKLGMCAIETKAHKIVLTLSIGTPRVSGSKKRTKMSAIVCHAPKKMKTPYFILHIINRNTCTILITQLTLVCPLSLKHASSSLRIRYEAAAISSSAGVSILALGEFKNSILGPFHPDRHTGGC